MKLALEARRPLGRTAVRVTPLGFGSAALGNLYAVVDDEVAGDPYLRDVLCLAAPAGLTVGVYTTAEAVSTLTASAVGQIVLLKRPETALALVKAGVPLPQLNVGNIAATPGSRRVVGSISLTPAHAASLDALAGQGMTFSRAFARFRGRSRKRVRTPG